MNTNVNSTMLDVIQRAGHAFGVCRACPFCGTDPLLPSTYEGFDLDTKSKELVRVKRWVIECENDDCPARPSVTGDSMRAALVAWNGRAGK